MEKCHNYKEQVSFYETMNDNVYLLKMIPGIKARVLESVFENYDSIVVESFGVGGIPKTISDDFFQLCQKYPHKLIVMATQVAHEGSDMTVYEVGRDIKAECRILESYDMTLESVIAKLMWIMGNKNLQEVDVEDVFYQSINYDLIFDKNRRS